MVKSSLAFSLLLLRLCVPVPNRMGVLWELFVYIGDVHRSVLQFAMDSEQKKKGRIDVRMRRCS